MPVDLVQYQKLATELSLHAIEHTINTGGKVLTSYWSKHKARDVSTYSQYVIRKGTQANLIRNLIYTTKSASLYDIYIPTCFTKPAQDTLPGQPRDYSDDGLLKVLGSSFNPNPQHRPAAAYVVLGTAGCGKSLFMRHAFFALQNLDYRHVPLLIEVRAFNRAHPSDLEDRIVDDCTSVSVPVTREQISTALESGLFMVLLDGMDELHPKLLPHYETQLRDFATKYPLCPILVSSRPMESAYSWKQFEIRRIARLDASTARKLVAKLDFDDKVKRKFRALLQKHLFKTHYELVSIPLLCIIMLLTYSDAGHLSHQRHEFFEDAFMALWSKHDSRKDGFQRQRYTGLQRTDFQRLVSAFAASSYAAADYDMRESQVTRHFQAATLLSGVKCEVDDFINDLVVSTSLATHDGPFLRFCHRSFQEYLAAVFLRDVDDSAVEPLIEEFADRLETDNVLPLALSMNDEKVEKHWVLKRIQRIERVIAKMTLSQYANLALQGGKYQDIKTQMDKIRVLYRFAVTTEEFLAGRDAMNDMRVSAKGIVEDSHNMGIFADDKDGFMSLAQQLREKYSRKSSALRDLVRGAC
jgi:hypothetical protein